MTTANATASATATAPSESASPGSPPAACGAARLAERLQDVQVARRTDLHVSRQVHADGVAYVVHHPVTFQSHRLTSSDYEVFAYLDGKRPLKKVFERLVEREILQADQVEGFYTFIVQLNAVGLLNLPISDGRKLHQRFQKRQESQKKSGLMRYLFFRVPLFSADEFLTRTMSFARPLFSRRAAIVWAMCLLTCLVIIVRRSADFVSPLAGMAAAGNLALMWGLLLGLKVVHEFGHAYACKNYGGRVPEMGAYFMMGSPCAYVDASSSWSFPDRRQRILVVMGGMYFESWAAMLAVGVWCLTGPGLLNSAAHMTILLSTVVTLAFNLNPLMRYDGYFALSDLLGLPHLRDDSNAELKRLVKRLMFGLEQPTVAETPAGQAGYVLFGIATALYRVAIVLGISLTLSAIVPGLGTSVLLFCLGSYLVKTIRATVNYLRTADEIAHCRRRAMVVSGCLAGFALMAAVVTPIPGGTRAVGVIAPAEQHVLYAAEPGFLTQAPVRNGDRVQSGDIICRLQDADAEFRVESARLTLESRATALTAELAHEHDPDRHTRAALSSQKLMHSVENFVQADQQHARLAVKSPASGVVTHAESIEVPGRYVQRGEQLAVVNSGAWEVRAIVDEESLADWQPQAGDTIQVRLRNTGRTLLARIRTIERTGSTRIADQQLWQSAGGSIPVLPESGEAQQPFFQVRASILNAGPDDESSLRDGVAASIKLGAARGTFGTLLFRNFLRLVHSS